MSTGNTGNWGHRFGDGCSKCLFCAGTHQHPVKKQAFLIAVFLSALMSTFLLLIWPTRLKLKWKWMTIKAIAFQNKIIKKLMCFLCFFNERLCLVLAMIAYCILKQGKNIEHSTFHCSHKIEQLCCSCHVNNNRWQQNGSGSQGRQNNFDEEEDRVTSDVQQMRPESHTCCVPGMCGVPGWWSVRTYFHTIKDKIKRKQNGKENKSRKDQEGQVLPLGQRNW